MIFHQPVNPHGVGAEAASNSIKALQRLLERLAEVTRRPRYNPRTEGSRVDGVLDAPTIWALAQVARDGLINIPGLGWVINKVLSVPGGFTAFRVAYRAGLEGEIDPPIKSAADHISGLLDIAAAKFASGGGGGQQALPDLSQLQVKKVQMVSTYPPGSVAVRDPVLNKYRILKPIV
jgi:hypothetical protein